MRVQVLLKAALYRGRFGADYDQPLKSSVMEIRGTAEIRDGGLELTVASLHDEKGRAVDAPFSRIFVPQGKIDFYVIEDDA